MHRPRFQQPESPGNPGHEPVASQPDPATLLHDIDAGLETIEATLAELERESTQYRESLGGISGAARLFDEAGLASEAATMHEGEQTIAEALSENERRRVELTETAVKLHLAREQIAPTGVDVAAQFAAAAAARLELTRETQVARHENGAVTERPVWQDEQDTLRFAPPAAPEQQPDTVAESPIVLAPAPPAPEPLGSDPNIDLPVAVVAADDGSGRRWTPLIVGAVLLIVLAGGTYVLASLLGGQDDDDSSSRSVAPAAATDIPSILGSSAGDASATTSASAALIVPAPTSTEQPAVLMSPTPSMPTPTAPPPTAAPQVAATTPPIPSIAPTPPPTPSTEPTPLATAVELATVVERVAEAEAGLQSGQIDASIEYPGGARATTMITFDLGAPGGTPSVAISTTYQNDAQTRTTELIMLGSQVWQRLGGGTWEEVDNVEGGRGQVQVFLPRIALVAEPQRDSDDRPGALHWYDAGRNADIQLQVDPESGVPEQLRQVSRETGSVLTVTYTSWNGPVQIDPPAIP